MPGMPSPVDGANNITSGEAAADPNEQAEAEMPMQQIPPEASQGPVM
jgi:hypothetical protein